MDDCHPVEIFSNTLRTPAPVTEFAYFEQPDERGNTRAFLPDDELDEVEGTVLRTLEAWVRAQKLGLEFISTSSSNLSRTVPCVGTSVWIKATPDATPSIIVPKPCQELLVRDTHARMQHLGSAKVYAILKRSYFWPEMKKDTRRMLENCPEREVNKARQNTTYALFHATPVHAPRARWCMDFQGQGTVTTGETEVLALIDPTSRYVVVIPLRDRQASTLLQPFLDRISLQLRCTRRPSFGRCP
jgi:hypothetical protein